jgi:hypothetical protein
LPLTVGQVVSSDQKTASARLVSPALAAGAGELLVAYVSADGPSQQRQQVTAVVGGGLTWSLAARSNTGGGTAEVWQAYTTQAIGQLRVTASLARGAFDGSITVASFKGAGKAVGATATAAGSKGAASVALTPSQDQSLVWGVGHDWSRAQAPVPLTGQTIVHQFLDTRVKDTFWTQRVNGAVGRGLPIRVGTSAPTGDRWQFVAVEITPLA